MIVGVVGFIGSGKGTVGDYLATKGYKKESFANSLKDATAAIFGWPRELLEGDTPASRRWREEKDEWWSEKLGREITPRIVLQQIGTEVFRNNFHQDIWVQSLIKRISDGGNYVITDARFFNEINAIKSAGGIIVMVEREKKPSWWLLATQANEGCQESLKELERLGIHRSESGWCGVVPNIYIQNNGSLEELYNKLDNLEF